MRRFAVLLVSICALPAHGEHVAVSDAVLHALTPIESIPTKKDIVRVLAAPVPELRDIALNAAIDFGVRLRAVRSLAFFCPDAVTCASTPAHTAILDVLASINRGDQTGTNLLLLRAAVEALGVTRSGADADVDLVVPILDHPSRDIRVAVAYALRDLCSARAIPSLRQRYQVEQIAQVRIAISDSLRDLDQCN